jgi:hypothetical protein
LGQASVGGACSVRLTACRHPAMSAARRAAGIRGAKTAAVA